MRVAAVFTLVLAACSNSSPPPHTLPPPDPAKLASMSFEDRCSAVAPRAMPCVDELLVADATSLADDTHGDVAAVVKDELQRNGKSSAKEANFLHRTECAADDNYPSDVMACWGRTDCTQLATCITQKRKARASKQRALPPAEPAAPDESQPREEPGR